MIYRTPFVELENGDITCTITIPAEHRGAAFSGEAITLPALPSAPMRVEMIGSFNASPLPGDSQQIGVGGFDTAEVMSTEILGGWAHPVAPYFRVIYEHAPFQQYALSIRPTADPFAAPMPHAIKLLQESRGLPPDQLLSGLGKLFDDYMAWAAAKNLPVWPEKSA